jgi:hypothetical protein
MPQANPEKSPTKITAFDFIIAFLLPTLIGKGLVIWFGALYSEYPGMGYGWAMIGAGVFTLSMIARFLWKYRNYKS